MSYYNYQQNSGDDNRLKNIIDSYPEITQEVNEILKKVPQESIDKSINYIVKEFK